MTEKLIATSPEGGKKKGKKSLDPLHAWALLGWVGLTFLVVGGSDFALTWYPTSFGNREWEFGTVTASFNGLPIVVLSLGLLVAASIKQGRRWWAILSFIASAGMMLWVIAGAVLWATNVPLALNAAPVEVLTGLKKALVKTTIQSAAYPVIFGFLAIRSFQATSGRRDEIS